jgi:hypothetical protein
MVWSGIVALENCQRIALQQLKHVTPSAVFPCAIIITLKKPPHVARPLRCQGEPARTLSEKIERQIGLSDKADVQELSKPFYKRLIPAGIKPSQQRDSDRPVPRRL